MPPSQLQLRAGAGALTMATAFEKADAGAGADADAAIARRKPVFRRIRAAETAEAAFEPAAAAHRMHFDDRGFVDGLSLVQSLAAAWPRTASLTNKLKQRRADSAAEATADADAGAEDLFGPMAYASAKAAREFNAATRMWREDNGGTWVDPHTGIRQVPANLQPTAVRAERVDATCSRWRRTGSTRVDALVSFTDAPALATPASDAYPLALLPGQFQSSFPVHHTRFGQTQAQALTSYSNLWSSHWTMQQIYAQQHRKLLQKRLAQ
ncbi:hypothetical protein GGF37_005898 [Kickxella alabastrina]|nr:hypothetical protein GGF37_005898 [Kickxella alabastrina]